MNDCVFCRIISGEIPAERVYEDDKMIVIRDAAPAAPVHVLMIRRNIRKTLLRQTRNLLSTCWAK